MLTVLIWFRLRTIEMLFFIGICPFFAQMSPPRQRWDLRDNHSETPEDVRSSLQPFLLTLMLEIEFDLIFPNLFCPFWAFIDTCENRGFCAAPFSSIYAVCAVHHCPLRIRCSLECHNLCRAVICMPDLTLAAYEINYVQALLPGYAAMWQENVFLLWFLWYLWIWSPSVFTDVVVSSLFCQPVTVVM